MFPKKRDLLRHRIVFNVTVIIILEELLAVTDGNRSIVTYQGTKFWRNGSVFWIGDLLLGPIWVSKRLMHMQCISTGKERKGIGSFEIQTTTCTPCSVYLFLFSLSPQQFGGFVYSLPCPSMNLYLAKVYAHCQGAGQLWQRDTPSSITSTRPQSKAQV